jgi:hypothetical protein
MKKHSYLAAAACAFALVFAAPALAQGKGQGMTGACKADVETFCKGIEPGGGRIMECLKQNEAKVSQGCKDQVAKARAEREARGPRGDGTVRAACEQDAKALCGSEVDPKARHQCMRANKDKLSQGCKDAMAKARAEHGKGPHDQGKDKAPE